MKTHFKDWAIPGPKPTGEAASGPALPDESIDALSGHFKIFQLKNGHRFSTDDLLTAWYGTMWCPSAGAVLDLGSGIGSVGMIAAWRLPGARFVTVEAQAMSVRLARKSAAFNGLTDRYDIRLGDFRDETVIAADETFDLVLGSPPYFPLDAGVHGDHEQKVACRFEVRGSILDYANVASRHLNLGGVFACVFPIDPLHQYDRVREAAKMSGLVIVRERPIVLREGEKPLLGVFIMTRASDLPPAFRETTWTEPALVVRTKEGAVHPEYSAVKLSIGFPP